MKRQIVILSAFAGALLFAQNASADIIHADDVLINDSLCVGFDCVNEEVFSFDTIRLKENSLRIHFEDSSVGSYPSNDSASGGASYFSVDDATAGRSIFMVETGAPSNSLYVDSTGRVGIKKANPVVELHLADGDTPTLRLEQDGSSGFTAQTWDVAGNETNFFVRDVTGGSRLPFRIRPGAPSSSIFIDTDGDVGIGTPSPGMPLSATVLTLLNLCLNIRATRH